MNIRSKKGARVATTLNINFSYIQGQLTPQSFMGPDQISNSSEIIMVVLVTVRNDEYPIKKGARVATTLHVDRYQFVSLMLYQTTTGPPNYLIYQCNSHSRSTSHLHPGQTKIKVHSIYM